MRVTLFQKTHKSKNMKEIIAKKIYKSALGIMAISIVLMLFISGLAPFNLSIAWSEQGIGSSLVLMQTEATAKPGTRVAGSLETQGKVSVYTVQDVTRKSGALYYDVTGGANENTTILASKFGQQAVVSVPLLGTWIKALGNPVGIMAFVGVPFSMFILNVLLVLGRRVLPAVSLVELIAERRVVRKERKMQKQATQAASQYHYEEEESHQAPRSDIQNELVTVLKPFRREYYNA